MSITTQPSSILKDRSDVPVIHLSYECILLERGRDADSYLYEIACSITYPVASAHLSIGVTGQKTFRNSAAREIPFTSHEAGATAYVELLEAEQLEIRIIEYNGDYCKAIYVASKQTFTEVYTRHVVSSIQQILPIIEG